MHRALAILLVVSVASAAAAQQTGGITGTVTAAGEALAGVTVEARSPVLPRARIAVSSEAGRYRFPLLPPGIYTLDFTSPACSASRGR